MRRRIHRGLVFGAVVVRRGAEWFATLFKGWLSAVITILALCGVAVVLVRLDPLWIVLLVVVIVGAALVKGAFRAWDFQESRAATAEKRLAKVERQLTTAKAEQGPTAIRITGGSHDNTFINTNINDYAPPASATALTGRRILLADLVRDLPSPVISDRVFEDCELVGPAVVLLEDCTVIEPRWPIFPTQISSLMWAIAPNRQGVIGALKLERCVLTRCRWVWIGLAGSQEELDAIQRQLEEGAGA